MMIASTLSKLIATLYVSKTDENASHTAFVD